MAFVNYRHCIVLRGFYRVHHASFSFPAAGAIYGGVGMHNMAGILKHPAVTGSLCHEGAQIDSEEA